jgi:hypothetical protein
MNIYINLIAHMGLYERSQGIFASIILEFLVSNFGNRTVVQLTYIASGTILETSLMSAHNNLVTAHNRKFSLCERS